MQHWLKPRSLGRTYLELGDRGFPPAGYIYIKSKEEEALFRAVLHLLEFEQTWNTGKIEYRVFNVIENRIQWRSEHQSHNTWFQWEWDQIFQLDPIAWEQYSGAIAGIEYGI